MKRRVLSRKTMFIDFAIGISLRELHHHSPCCPDNLPGQKNVLQAKSLDLLTVFHYFYPVNLEQQEQVVRQHHQLENGCKTGYKPQSVRSEVRVLPEEL